jgi:hypothetical protein
MANWLHGLDPATDVTPAVALAVALIVIWQGRRCFAVLFRAPKALTLALLGALALALSFGYVQQYLRGGPRIIDATSYWLEARALAEGYTTWPIEEPTASVRGRFLLLGGPAQAPHLGVIFPPGYPLALALGFLFGVPLWIGPILAAVLVVATYALAKAVSGREDVARLAATMSVLCAALRYHTADTMSHGLAALLFATTAGLGFAAVDADSAKKCRTRALLTGASFGWLVATRPISALALLPILLLVLTRLRLTARLFVAAGAVIPVALFLLQQRAVTGAFFVSSQSAYYAVADGPPGCFRYGFGRGIGCLHEHGGYVAAVLPNGLDATAVTTTFLRRLRLHLIDVANLEPLALLAFAAPFLARFRGKNDAAAPLRDIDAPRTAALALSVAAIFIVYLPFYFDGSYAGGGARLFADILPLEHVLIAIAVALLVERGRARFASLDLPRAAAALGALAIGGFALHAVFEHRMLRDREGGRPFFEPAVLAAAKIDRGLLFVGTDHAFNLAYDPAVRDAARGLVVAREFGDDRDRLLWENLGEPAAYRYVFEGRDGVKPAVVAWNPAPPPHPYRFEAEAEWPPIRQTGGSFEPVFAQGTCAWGGRLLAVQSEPDRPFDGAISFPVPAKGTYRLSVHLASAGDVTARFVLRESPGAPPLATWTFSTTRRDFNCATLTEEFVNLAGKGILEVTTRGGSKLFLDAIALDTVTSVASTH